jgi:hypothetical protein
VYTSKKVGGDFAMNVESTLYVVAVVLALLLLVIVVAFGAIVAITQRNRRSGFSYFAEGITTPRITDF